MQQDNSITTELKGLPFSKSSISTIINDNLLYIDKTKFAYEMLKISGNYFLSRPRRFGKSMLLSTFEEIFKGNKELFKDQWIYNSPWKWQVYPIIRLDFNIASTTDLMFYIKNKLKLIAIHYDVFDEKEFEESPYDIYFGNLILKLYDKSNGLGVVVLIDEYDKPILDAIEDVNVATQKRDILKGFYTVMKGVDEQLRFVFLTGVSRFSKVGVFSGLNNLRDISMENDFASACGITQEELEFYCKEHIKLLALANNLTYEECLQKIRDWYNGFCFAKNGISVYNPFSTMNVLVKKEFSNYWFSSGNASFIIKLMKQQQNLNIFQLNEYKTGASAFDNFDISNLNIIAILFQAGYLTIKSYDQKSDKFILSYPNREVSQSFKENVLTLWSRETSGVSNTLSKLSDALQSNDIKDVMILLTEIFLNIDYDIKLSNENHYQSIFYLIFQLLGFEINVEYKTARGRIDAIIQTTTHIYIFEFKLDKTAAEALAQIKEMNYAVRFMNDERPVYIIGANFSSEQRTIDDYVIEEIT